MNDYEWRDTIAVLDVSLMPTSDVSSQLNFKLASTFEQHYRYR